MSASIMPSHGLPLVPLQAVAIDLDGTLLDTLADLAGAANAMRTALGLPALAQERLMSFVGGGMANLVHRALTDHPDGRADDTAHQAGLAIFITQYEKLLTATTRPYPGVVEGLQAMQALGLQLACVTNKPLRFTLPLLQRTGLAPFFQITLGGDSLPEKKPSPMPLRHVCQQFGIEPAALLMVGDSHFDLEAARNTGCPCVLLDYGYEDIAPLQADAHCSSLVAVVEFVKNRRSTFSDCTAS